MLHLQPQRWGDRPRTPSSMLCVLVQYRYLGRAMVLQSMTLVVSSTSSVNTVQAQPCLAHHPTPHSQRDTTATKPCTARQEHQSNTQKFRPATHANYDVTGMCGWHVLVSHSQESDKQQAGQATGADLHCCLPVMAAPLRLQSQLQATVMKMMLLMLLLMLLLGGIQHPRCCWLNYLVIMMVMMMTA